jgi:Cyclin
MSSTAASSTTASSGASTNTVTERGKAYVTVLSCVLSRLVASNDAMPDTGPVTKFHALRPPSISIHDYCMRIYKYASCSPECFVLALVFIDRLIQRNALLLTSLNVHRVIITAVMLAAKFFDDQYFNNAYYAKVGGVPTTEVNSLELEFLFSINFSLHVPTDVYEKYYGELGSLSAANDCLKALCLRRSCFSPFLSSDNIPSCRQSYGRRSAAGANA